VYIAVISKFIWYGF